MITFKPTFQSWAVIWNQDILGYVKNTLVVSVLSSLLTVLLSTPIAYALVRFRFLGRDRLTLVIFAVKGSAAFSVFCFLDMRAVFVRYACGIVTYRAAAVLYRAVMHRHSFNDIRMVIFNLDVKDSSNMLNAIYRSDRIS